MKSKNKRFETVQALLIAIFVALLLRQFVVAAYKIPTGSMEDTLLVGDFLLVNKFVYGAKFPGWIGVPFLQDKDWVIPTGFSVPKSLQIRFPALTHPKPNDIVVFKPPFSPTLDYIKRCIAVGGQEVYLTNKTVYVDGKPFPLPPKLKFIDHNILWQRDNLPPLMVKENHYFMMGDNRDNSSDSREWGQVPFENIVGKPLIVYLSLKENGGSGHFFDKIRWQRLGMVVR